jgi:hypothetical protein
LVDFVEISVVNFDHIIETGRLSDALFESSIGRLDDFEHEVIGHVIDEMRHLPSL